jgi:hypothetical protein
VTTSVRFHVTWYSHSSEYATQLCEESEESSSSILLYFLYSVLSYSDGVDETASSVAGSISSHLVRDSSVYCKVLITLVIRLFFKFTFRSETEDLSDKGEENWFGDGSDLTQVIEKPIQ